MSRPQDIAMIFEALSELLSPEDASSKSADPDLDDSEPVAFILFFVYVHLLFLPLCENYHAYTDRLKFNFGIKFAMIVFPNVVF